MLNAYYKQKSSAAFKKLSAPRGRPCFSFYDAFMHPLPGSSKVRCTVVGGAWSNLTNRWGGLPELNGNGRSIYEPRHRTAYLRNEARTVVMLRRKGHAMTAISQLLGAAAGIGRRSLSYVQRICQANRQGVGLPGATIGRCLDLRKLKGPDRSAVAKRRLKSLLKTWAAWLAFLRGEVDEPP